MPDTSAVKRALGSVRDSTPSATGKTSATAEAGTEKGQFYKPLPKEFRLFPPWVRIDRNIGYPRRWFTAVIRPLPSVGIGVPHPPRSSLRGRTSYTRKAFRCACGWNTDRVSGTGIGGNHNL